MGGVTVINKIICNFVASNQYTNLIKPFNPFKLMTTKKHYEKPVMQAFELKQQSQMLAGSNNSQSTIPDNEDYTSGLNPFGA